ncbi:glycosyltransferase family 9 protein [Deminuibacter soli]|uniref:Lipopolysaccharide heptosyltransferase family protein n=1 Tax=Deminuibacter soli TaxID=2291815 RepID=A0A3E1NDK5_9BACT|nr:glycosyltransferase family 9 protein [Deminuibacter soli]RFM26020.1 lipopolysaccharide heptosyltransferase family protein [Deminuibacter soli]
MKVLIVRLSSIGDIVLTTPVVRCVKQQVQEAEVHYLTKKSFATLLNSNPYVSKVHVLGDDWDAMIAALQAEQFDCIIDLHHNLRTLRIKRALKKVPAYSFNKLNVQKWLLTALKINRMPPVHIVDRYLDAAKTLGVVNDGRGLDYFIPAKDEVPVTDLPMSHHAGYVAVVIGAALNTKKLPLAKLQQLCASLQHPVVLLGGPEDRAAGELIAAQDTVKIYNACGKFNLNESAHLVRNARLVVTHDTGLMHVAAAFKKQIISVWGNTVPAFGMTPYYGNAVVNAPVFEVNGLSCRPCSKIGYKKCPKGHFKCMNNQDIPAIVQAVEKGIKKVQ